MLMVRILISAAALSTAPLATAAEPAPTAASSEHRLSPEQVEKVLEEAARKREGLGMPAEPDSVPDAAPVHGEIGFSIGTGGYRSAYGTAVVGLPGDGVAILSLGTQKLPEDHFYPYW